jgi:predicted DNA-binding transcriptional regulator AlpA
MTAPRKCKRPAFGWTMQFYREPGMSLAKTEDHRTRKKPSAQVAFAKKAAALKADAEQQADSCRQERLAANQLHIAEAALAADVPRQRHEREHVHSGRAPPVHLLDKNDILAITHVTFPTIWAWMRAGTFPRSLVVVGKSMWRSDEIDAWLAKLPKRVLKGDAEVEVG